MERAFIKTEIVFRKAVPKRLRLYKGDQCIPFVNGIMNSENAPQKIVKSFIDLTKMAKGLLDEQQAFFKQELERLYPRARGGRRGGERRELHWVDASESPASTKTDTNTSFATPSTTKRMISEI